MASFFRRKKPTGGGPGTRGGLDIEALAAAFPSARPQSLDSADKPEVSLADAIDMARRSNDALGDVDAADAAAAVASARAVEQTVAADDGAQTFADTASAPTPSPAGALPLPPLPPTPPLPQPGADALQTRSDALQTRADTPQARVVIPPQTVIEPAAPITTPVEQTRPVTAEAAIGKSGWRERLRGSGFARGMSGLFSRNPKLDDDLLDEIETALLLADVGVKATTALLADLRKRMKAREFADATALLASLRAQLIRMLQPVSIPLVIDAQARPFVILTVGVNGVGKTTTIGKLANRYKAEGRTLMLAAGDTFRAAAVAQLQSWGERHGVAVIAQGQNAQGKGGDAASVAFDALQAAKARGIDVLIADTAGRLHTQQGLMDELGKIKRVLGKLDAAAPHEVLMVIDGTTGQNALSQLRQFHAAAGVTGLVVTKLDGSAKGGVVFALAAEFNIPIRFAGIGERPEDLRVFDAEAFVDALLPEALGA